MASGIYTGFKHNLMHGAFNLATDTVKVALMAVGHAFTAANTVWANVSANELGAGGGYPNGDSNVLQSPTVTQDDGTAKGIFDAADISWTSATFTAYHAVIYDDTTTGDMLIASIDFGGAMTVTAGTFTISWSASGIITIS